MKTFRFNTLVELRDFLNTLPEEDLVKEVTMVTWSEALTDDEVIELTINDHGVEIVGDGRGIL